MKKSTETTDQKVLELLETLRETPSRDARAAARGREKFTREMESLPKPVSVRPFGRLIGWKLKPNVWLKKERSPMLTTISAILITLALVLGGGGATAYASQDSLPTEALYPVKLWMEDAQLSWTSDANQELALLTDFANRRVDESVELALQGEAIPEPVMDRLMEQLQTMLQLAAEFPEGETAQALLQIQQRLRTQDQLMTMLGQPETVSPQMDQLRAILEAQHQITQSGTENPLQFQQMFQYNQPADPAQGPDAAPGNQGENQGQDGDCDQSGDCIPIEDGTGPGPGPNAGSGESNGNGPGTGECQFDAECTPDGSGSGPQETQDPGNSNQGSGGDNGSDNGQNGKGK